MLIQKIQYLYELFSTFTCANNIGNLVNNFFGVKMFNPLPSFTSSPSSGSTSGMSTNSSPSSDDVSVKLLSSDFFCLFNFSHSAIVL